MELERRKVGESGRLEDGKLERWNEGEVRSWEGRGLGVTKLESHVVNGQRVDGWYLRNIIYKTTLHCIKTK